MVGTRVKAAIKPNASAKHAQKIAIEYVFPKRRGVLIRTSEFTFFQPCASIICGFEVSQSALKITRAAALQNATWNSSCCADLVRQRKG